MSEDVVAMPTEPLYGHEISGLFVSYGDYIEQTQMRKTWWSSPPGLERSGGDAPRGVTLTATFWTASQQRPRTVRGRRLGGPRGARVRVRRGDPLEHESRVLPIVRAQ